MAQSEEPVEPSVRIGGDLPDWRQEFPAEGPTPDEPLPRRQRYCQLLLGEMRQKMQAEKAEILRSPEEDEKRTAEWFKSQTALVQALTRSFEAEIRWYTEVARYLGINAKEARTKGARELEAKELAKTFLEQVAQEVATGAGPTN
jgi:hypothetical protein